MQHIQIIPEIIIVHLGYLTVPFPDRCTRKRERITQNGINPPAPDPENRKKTGTFLQGSEDSRRTTPEKSSETANKPKILPENPLRFQIRHKTPPYAVILWTIWTKKHRLAVPEVTFFKKIVDLPPGISKIALVSGAVRCPSGWRSTPGKRVYGINRIKGSNPFLRLLFWFPFFFPWFPLPDLRF